MDDDRFDETADEQAERDVLETLVSNANEVDVDSLDDVEDPYVLLPDQLCYAWGLDMTELLGGGARARLIAVFSAEPNARKTVQELARLTGLARDTIERHLDALVTFGAVAELETETETPRYCLDTEHGVGMALGICFEMSWMAMIDEYDVDTNRSGQPHALYVLRNRTDVSYGLPGKRVEDVSFDYPDDVDTDTSTDTTDVLTEILGANDDRVDALRDAGYESVADLKDTSQRALAAVDGVDPGIAARIKSQVGDLDVDATASTTAGDASGDDGSEASGDDGSEASGDDGSDALSSAVSSEQTNGDAS